MPSYSEHSSFYYMCLHLSSVKLCKGCLFRDASQHQPTKQVEPAEVYSRDTSGSFGKHFSSMQPLQPPDATAAIGRLNCLSQE